jgi:hypothetical protein
MVAGEVTDILKKHKINSFSGSRCSWEYISWVYPSGLAAAYPSGLVRGRILGLGGLW